MQGGRAREEEDCFFGTMSTLFASQKRPLKGCLSPTGCNSKKAGQTLFLNLSLYCGLITHLASTSRFRPPSSVHS
jgi:hypothetical protein